LVVRCVAGSIKVWRIVHVREYEMHVSNCTVV
jgi:hypothetical protein